MVLLDDPTMLGGTLMHHRIDTIPRRVRQALAHHLDPESIHHMPDMSQWHIGFGD